MSETARDDADGIEGLAKRILIEEIGKMCDALIAEIEQQQSSTGGCPTGHASDCAVHNAPAEEPGPCDCGANTPHD